MPMHPSQWHLSDTLSGALCWILLNVSRLPSVLHLLDDFLLIDPPSSPPTSLQTLKDLFLRVGVPLSREKTLGPSTKLEFLGINLDSDQMLASLPEDKLARIRQISRSHLSSSVLSKRDLLSLLGHLNFAMCIIPQGRSFISRLLDLANSVPHLLDQVSLVRSLLLVRTARPLERHLFFFYEDVISPADAMQFFTDAAPSAGFGGFFQDRWFAVKWLPLFPHSESSAFYDIIPIAAACCVWGHLWVRKRIVVFCDNTAVVEAINKGRSSSSIMPFLRRITWQLVIHNFIISARHVPGHANAIADALSRLCFQTFRQLCPSASPFLTPVPSLWSLCLD
ncbi:uncharacterized protein LOC103129532 [Poecilia formosa]|uniref:uncharacterized protein LOC103129532 n=1 Tax=Poecilia formosa TaxID=48698 RepID=UPI0007BA2C7D|nr:PREDICTED: uncharacterized protein LOC103129532 [Poecilia formosa]